MCAEEVLEAGAGDCGNLWASGLGLICVLGLPAVLRRHADRSIEWIVEARINGVILVYKHSSGTLSHTLFASPTFSLLPLLCFVASTPLYRDSLAFFSND